MIPSDEPLFSVVYAVQHTEEEFEIQGVFSNDADADKYIEQLNQNPHYSAGSACKARLPMGVIKRSLLLEYIGVLEPLIHAPDLPESTTAFKAR